MGLYGACRGGHLDIVDLVIALGATDYDWGLHLACQRGHLDIALLLINKGRWLSSSFTSRASIDNLNAETIVKLLNFGLNPQSVNANQDVKQKVLERKNVQTIAEKILNICAPKDIFHHVVATYVRYE
jgi:ankyrin repeat protein